MIHISSFTAVSVKQVNQAHCWEQVPVGEKPCSTSSRSPRDVPWLRHSTVGQRCASSLLETAMGKERQSLAPLSFIANCEEDSKCESSGRQRCSSQGLSLLNVEG